MLDVTFKVAGTAQYARSFDAMGRELESMRDPLGQVAGLLVQSTGEQFRTEGSHGAGGWEPLNPEYDAWKQEAFPGRPMLVRTGDMRSAFLTDGTRDLTDTSLRWGVDTQRDEDGHPIADRALAHQTGQGVPQREIVALSKLDRRGIDRVFVSWLNDVRRRSGLGR